MPDALEAIGGLTLGYDPGASGVVMSIEDREAVLEALLSEHPDALLTGFTEGGS